MGLKPDWSLEHHRARSVVLPSPARAIIDRASRLTRAEIVRLDIADREHPELQLAMWDVLRSQLETEPARTLRFMARNEAWAAVNVSLAAAGIDEAIDDGYWRVTTRVGWGAARAARFAACAAVERTPSTPT